MAFTLSFELLTRIALLGVVFVENLKSIFLDDIDE